MNLLRRFEMITVEMMNKMYVVTVSLRISFYFNDGHIKV